MSEEILLPKINRSSLEEETLILKKDIVKEVSRKMELGLTAVEISVLEHQYRLRNSIKEWVESQGYNFKAMQFASRFGTKYTFTISWSL